MGMDHNTIRLFFREPIAFERPLFESIVRGMEEHGLHLSDPTKGDCRLSARGAICRHHLLTVDQWFRDLPARRGELSFVARQIGGSDHHVSVYYCRTPKESQLEIVPWIHNGWAYNEREMDCSFRVNLAALWIAKVLDMDRVMFDVEQDDPPITRSPFAPSGETTCVNGLSIRERENAKAWMATRPADYPVEPAGSEMFPYYRVWSEGKRGQGRPAQLECDLYDAGLTKFGHDFDWLASEARIGLLKTMWQCRHRKELFLQFGPPNFTLGPVEHTAEDRDEYGLIGISEQFVYTRVLRDAMVIIREWSDRIFTAIAAKWES